MNAGLWVKVVRTAAIALLTPLILLAGLIAVAAVPAVVLSTRVSIVVAAGRDAPLAPVMRLEASDAEAGAALLSRRAA